MEDNCVVEQTYLFESGNELAAWAAKQIDYHVMGYYPITPSTQIAEEAGPAGQPGRAPHPHAGRRGRAQRRGHLLQRAAARRAGCSTPPAPTACSTPWSSCPCSRARACPWCSTWPAARCPARLCIKGDHSPDIMYALNAGWIILFAQDPQQVYDFNLCALRVAEAVNLPVIVAYDGFFTSHQKHRCAVMAQDETPAPSSGRTNRRCRPWTQAPGDHRLLHERARRDQQPISAAPGHGAGAPGDRAGLRRVRRADRPDPPRVRRIPRRGTPRRCCSCWGRATPPPRRRWIGCASRASAWGS